MDQKSLVHTGSPKDTGAPKKEPAMDLKGYLKRAASYAYGGLVLLFVGWAFVKEPKPSQKTKEEEEKARERLWSLTHPSDFTHHFIQTNGVKLHYVSILHSHVKAPNLVIFLHGWPDSWAVWYETMSSQQLREQCALIALDLPGFGGSADLAKYGPDEVLETVAQFIMQMREQYIDSEEDIERGRVIVVAHDWGGAIAYRLAAEAPALADRFVISNTFHPALAKSNFESRLTGAKLMLHNWSKQPSLSMKFRMLKKAAINLGPAFSQLKRSGYIFAFNLPMWIISRVGSIGDYTFLRLVLALAVPRREDREGPEAARIFAAMLGPSTAQAQQTGKDSLFNSTETSYDPSVAKRAPTAGWSTKIRLYREGLALGQWTKSLELIYYLQELEERRPSQAFAPRRRRASVSSPIFDTAPKGALKAPTTVVWGEKDRAIDCRIALDGISEFMCRGSHVVYLKGVGHWVPHDPKGVQVLEKVISWSLKEEGGKGLKDAMGPLDYVKMTVEK